MAIQELSSGLAEIEKLNNDELKEILNCESNQKYDDIVDQTDRVSIFV